MHIAQRLSNVAPSATLALAQRAREMAAAGQSVVGLTAGEPDFDTPAHITEALKASLDAGRTRYTAVAGTHELRSAIQARYADRGLHYSVDQIVASTGAKQSIFNALMATVDPGDEVVIAAPYWVSYVDMVRVAEGQPKIVTTTAESGFVMRPDALEAALTARTRAVIINSPSNPTGAVYDRSTLTDLAEVLARRPDVMVIADEIYDRLVYGERAFDSIVEVAPDLADRTVIVSGCSKTYAMTGLRLGWALGPKPVVSAMINLQGQSTSNATAPVQDAAIAALTGDQTPVQTMVAAFDLRRRAVVDALNAMDGVTCFEPRGAFYAFPSLKPYVGRRAPNGTRIDSVDALVDGLLEAVQVVVVPGSAFGAPDHLRLSYAADPAVLDEGLKRMREYLGRLT